MGVDKYTVRGVTYWKIDERVVLPNGETVRLRQRRVPTKELAVARAAKMRAEAFEGRFFDRVAENALTVREAWAHYEPVNRRDNDAHQTEAGRMGHIQRHLGGHRVMALSQRTVDDLRDRRLAETTRRGRPPAPATLDREVELLKRTINYAVKCGLVPHNPIATVSLLGRPNVRRQVVTADVLARLVAAADEPLRSMVLLAVDTGMRKGEVHSLEWSWVDLSRGTIELPPDVTKTDAARVVMLTERAVEVLRALRRHPGCPAVFVNWETGEPWRDLARPWKRALRKAGLSGVWFHDLRRTFVTEARRAGVPESVVMRMSGHRTRAVFDRYNVVSEDDLRAAVARIQAPRRGHDLGKAPELP